MYQRWKPSCAAEGAVNGETGELWSTDTYNKSTSLLLPRAGWSSNLLTGQYNSFFSHKVLRVSRALTSESGRFSGEPGPDTGGLFDVDCALSAMFRYLLRAFKKQVVLHNSIRGCTSRESGNERSTHCRTFVRIQQHQKRSSPLLSKRYRSKNAA